MIRKNSWRPEEDAVLRDNYFDASREELFAMLPDRTWHAIRDRAHTLGIRRDRGMAQRRSEYAKRNEIKLASERAVLEYIIDYHKRFGFGPTRMEISEDTGRAHSSVGNIVDRLVKRGLCIRQSGKNRAVGLAPALRRRLELREREKAVA